MEMARPRAVGSVSMATRSCNAGASLFLSFCWSFMTEHRHLPHLSSFRDNPIVFFTTCTRKRRKLLACAESHVILRGLWERSAERDGWWVGHYILMPNPWRAGCRCGRASVRASSRQHWTSRRPFGNGITLIDIYGRGKIMAKNGTT